MGKYLDKIRQHEQYERTHQIETAKTEEALTWPQALDPIPPAQPGWRELARMTAGLEQDDPRLSLVLDTMRQGAKAQDVGDTDGFEHAIQLVHFLMQFAPGSLVRWHGSEGHLLTVLGPAAVEHVHVDAGQLWVWTSWKGQERWVPASIIATIKSPR